MVLVVCWPGGIGAASDGYREDATRRLEQRQSALSTPGWVIPSEWNPKSEDNVQNRSDILGVADNQLKTHVSENAPESLPLQGPKGGGVISVAGERYATNSEPQGSLLIEDETRQLVLGGRGLSVSPRDAGSINSSDIFAEIKNGVVSYVLLGNSDIGQTVVWVKKDESGYWLMKENFSQQIVTVKYMPDGVYMLDQSTGAYNKISDRVFSTISMGLPTAVRITSGDGEQIIAFSKDPILLRKETASDGYGESFNWSVTPRITATDAGQTTASIRPILGQRDLYPKLRDELAISQTAYNQVKELNNKQPVESLAGLPETGEAGAAVDYNVAERSQSRERAYEAGLKHLNAAAEALAKEEGLDAIIAALNSKKDKTDIESGMLEAAEALVREREYIDDETMQEFTEAMQCIRIAESMRDAFSGVVDFSVIKAALDTLTRTQTAAYNDYIVTTEATYVQLEELLKEYMGMIELPEELGTLALDQRAKRKILVDLAIEEIKRKDGAALSGTEKLSIEIYEKVIWPVREKYSATIQNAVKAFAAAIKDTFRDKAPAALKDDGVSSEAVIFIDERVTR
ncbi:MAG: hypothetical protein NC938_04600 [Candidatus Omnitrophica bacterium]|nr:hypothetical protein [Candidatus Omnitrophota bacterium]